MMWMIIKHSEHLLRWQRPSVCKASPKQLPDFAPASIGHVCPELRKLPHLNSRRCCTGNSRPSPTLEVPEGRQAFLGVFAETVQAVLAERWWTLSAGIQDGKPVLVPRHRPVRPLQRHWGRGRGRRLRQIASGRKTTSASGGEFFHSAHSWPCASWSHDPAGYRRSRRGLELHASSGWVPPRGTWFI